MSVSCHVILSALCSDVLGAPKWSIDDGAGQARSLCTMD
jgi:hypothetical protein